MWGRWVALMVLVNCSGVSAFAVRPPAAADPALLPVPADERQTGLLTATCPNHNAPYCRRSRAPASAC